METKQNVTTALRRGTRARRLLLALAILVTLLGLFYTEENWRGKRGWEKFKAEEAQRGITTDWQASIPPPVPDEQNFFKAPNMQAGFVGRGETDFSRRISVAGLDDILIRRGVMPCVDVTVVPADAQVATNDTDLVLRYHRPLLSVEKNESPLAEVRPTPNHLQVKVERSAEAIKQMLTAFGPRVDVFKQDADLPKLTDVNQRAIGLKPLAVFTPFRLIVRTDDALSAEEVEQFFPTQLRQTSTAELTQNRNIGYGGGARSTGDHSFRAELSAAPYVPAADFVAWSDSFQDQFDALRLALDRPYARMDGDYEHPAWVPIPNFICARVTAQMLAMRTQAYLVLGEPEKALRELTLLHHLTRMFEGRPTGEPMTLVAAMINVAVRGLYVAIVGDGLRLHAWREPQLAVIQQQLAETDLLPYVRTAFRFEGLSFGRMAESSSSKELADAYTWEDRDKGFWVKLKHSEYDYIRLVPHGWLLQNALKNAERGRKVLATMDVSNHLILPAKVDELSRELEESVRHRTAFTYLSSASVPNFQRALQTTAHNQTLVNEALIACALERYRLAHGRYPETLDALTPEFAEKIPNDVIGGAPLKYRLEDGQFVLYSIGWNEKDDGGTFNGEINAPIDLAKNDWVWAY